MSPCGSMRPSEWIKVEWIWVPELLRWWPSQMRSHHFLVLLRMSIQWTYVWILHGTEPPASPPSSGHFQHLYKNEELSGRMFSRRLTSSQTCRRSLSCCSVCGSLWVQMSRAVIALLWIIWQFVLGSISQSKVWREAFLEGSLRRSVMRMISRCLSVMLNSHCCMLRGFHINLLLIFNNAKKGCITDKSALNT